jgi:DNA (cytosine-5)-methyltransferase 1
MNMSKSIKKKIKVVELFAGVGGFRVGFERAAEKSRKIHFETVWASQWEPASGKNQHAAWVYEQKFFRERGLDDVKVIDKHLSNVDIGSITCDDSKMDANIPDHDLLCGGFPCQDYSVARTLNQAAGLKGKKGVLWWSIYEIVRRKLERGKAPKVLFLENVDRLLKSPAGERGRDFAIMLSSLNKLGYVVEWRVINAGEYGLPQRRRRTFILAFHSDTKAAKNLMKYEAEDYLAKVGVMASAFPVKDTMGLQGSFSLDTDPVRISSRFRLIDVDGQVDARSPFQNAGIIVNGRVTTIKVASAYKGRTVTLGDVIKETDEMSVPHCYYITPNELKKWEAEKGSHRFERTSKSGHAYTFSEGALPFPDYLDRPSRTIVTGEGGRGASRFKHTVDIRHKGIRSRIVSGEKMTHRRLVPEELESLCMFDRGHTAFMYHRGKGRIEEVSPTKRAFFMGNALVVGVIERIALELDSRL